MNYQLTELDFGRIFDSLAPDFAGFLGLHDSAIEVNVHGSLGEVLTVSHSPAETTLFAGVKMASFVVRLRPANLDRIKASHRSGRGAGISQ